MEPQRLLAYQLRIAVVILEDAARSIRGLPLERRGDWMRQVASSLASVFDLLKDVCARHPEVDPSKDATPSESSADAEGHRRVSSSLARAYLLMAENRKDEAVSLLTDNLVARTFKLSPGVRFPNSERPMTPNRAVEPTAQSVLASLALLWVPSLRSAAAHRERWASEITRCGK
jgi:hypothetical protein